MTTAWVRLVLLACAVAFAGGCRSGSKSDVVRLPDAAATAPAGADAAVALNARGLELLDAEDLPGAVAAFKAATEADVM